jgi:peptidoglycan/LPS O-acetylase OafA/YrhL
MVDSTPVPAPEALDEPGEVTTGTESGAPGSAVAPTRPRHFPCFDGLRAIAAVTVVMVHTSFDSGFTLRSSAGIYTARLEIGVAVFFLISGFLLYRPFAASHIAGGAPPAVGRFWARRFLRILPAYWLAFVVTSYVMKTNLVIPGWRSLLISLGLLQIYFPSHALTGITQAWSLCTEISFYLFLPLYAMAIAARRRSDYNQLVREVAAVGALYVTGLVVRFELLEHPHSQWTGAMRSWLPSYFDLFALGMLLAVASSWLAHRKAEPAWLWHPAMPWVSWGLAALAFWLVSHVGISRLPLHGFRPDQGMAQEILYGLFAFFLLAPAVFGPQHRGAIRRALSWKPVALLGVVSYGLYLWHQSWATLFLRWTGLQFHVAWWKMFLVVLALGTATATLSYALFERPILNLKDRLGWWSGIAGARARMLNRSGAGRPPDPPPVAADIGTVGEGPLGP